MMARPVKIGGFRGSKYHSCRTTYDGIEFDSRFEARRYGELKLMEQAGEITGLERQVEFELIPEQREPDTYGPKGGLRKGRVIEKKCTYVADFVYDEGGVTVVEDTKSPATRTKDYRIKKKLMLFVWGIRIRETCLR